MALILPAAPKNFYNPSFLDFKTKLLAVNGLTQGKLTLLIDPPTTIETAWAEVGAAGDTVSNTNRGTLVIGSADIVGISDPIVGPEEITGETGYKVQIAVVPSIPIYIDGTGSTTATVKGVAAIEGVDTFAAGTDGLVRYLFNVNDILVTDGGLISTPVIEVTINYSESV